MTTAAHYCECAGQFKRCFPSSQLITLCGSSTKADGDAWGEVTRVERFLEVTEGGGRSQCWVQGVSGPSPCCFRGISGNPPPSLLGKIAVLRGLENTVSSLLTQREAETFKQLTS